MYCIGSMNQAYSKFHNDRRFRPRLVYTIIPEVLPIPYGMHILKMIPDLPP